jgi:HD-GYP domain-containing protein (c-di-GMP phosphodiesterase class II)
MIIWIAIAAVTAVVNLVVADLAGWLPRLAELIVRHAVCLLPTREQDRYEDEWLAELDALPGRGISAIVFAFRLFVSARGVGRELVGWRDASATSASEPQDGSTSALIRALSELETAQAETVRRLSIAVEFRDILAGGHIDRVGRFSRLLAEHMRMDTTFCERLSHAAPLHDVGKVAVPDAILLKPGPLTPEERAISETHAEEGHRLLRGSSSPILDMAATIALTHQEKWDGTGFPRGLTGQEIPVEGRIVAIADIFDALTSDRAYRDAFSAEEAVRMMREQRGHHFDPDLLDAFLDNVLGEAEVA